MTALQYLQPTLAFRWYERRDKDAWVNEGIERRIRTLQQYWTNTVIPGPQGEWRDVPEVVIHD